MAQDTLYFPHDYDPLSDPGIRKLIRKHGAIGYAVFWRAVEYLHQNADHSIGFESGILDDIADDLYTNKTDVESIIESCVNGCNLFGADGQIFWSDRVFKNIDKRKEMVRQRSLAGRASAEARKRDKEATDDEQPLNNR